MADEHTNDPTEAEKIAKRRAVRDQFDRLSGDAASLGRSVSDWLEVRTRQKPLQTVALALAIGWLIGKRA